MSNGGPYGVHLSIIVKNFFAYSIITNSKRSFYVTDGIVSVNQT